MLKVNLNNSTINSRQVFGAKTRREREEDTERTYNRYVRVVMSTDDYALLERAKREEAHRISQAKNERTERARNQQEEKQYREDVKELKETNAMVQDLTQQSNSGLLKGIGKVADVIITGTLSGMALHWSTGKSYSLLYKLCKKPKVTNAFNKVKRPFQIVGSALKEGVITTSNSIKNQVKNSQQGQKFLESKPVKFANNILDRIKMSYRGLKQDLNSLTHDNVKAGISTVFGVSGFATGVGERLDAYDKQKRNEVEVC